MKHFLGIALLFLASGEAFAEKQLKASSFGFSVQYPVSISKGAVAEVSPWDKLTDPSEHPAAKAPEHVFFRFPGPSQEVFEKLRAKNVFTFAPEIHFYSLEGFQEVFAIEPKYGTKLKKDVAFFGKLLAEKNPKPKYLQDTLFMSYPFGDVAETFLAKPHKLKFRYGEGIAFVTQMYFDMAPFNPEALVYVFQGLTKNSKYLVTATFPINPDIAISKEEIEEYQKTYSKNPRAFSEYLAKIKVKLENLSDKQFNPPIGTLDEIVESIAIK